MKPDKDSQARSRPVTVSRIYPASREMVFNVWSTSEHIREWFCPDGFTVPEACVEFKVGGVFDVCMGAPDGETHWVRGRFVAIDSYSRLAIDMDITDVTGHCLFRANTSVTFSDAGEATRMEVVQCFTIVDPAAAWMIDGAPEGLRQTLDRLDRILTEKRTPTFGQTVVHGTFTLERLYQAAPSQVFRALSDPNAKARWFVGGEGYTVLSREMNVTPGGREHLKGRWKNGLVSRFEAIYHDIILEKRLLYTYEMFLDERKISISLATIELSPEGASTRLRLTEQGAFLDGYDDAGSREQGTNLLLDALGHSLELNASVVQLNGGLKCEGILREA